MVDVVQSVVFYGDASNVRRFVENELHNSNSMYFVGMIDDTPVEFEVAAKVVYDEVAGYVSLQTDVVETWLVKFLMDYMVEIDYLKSVAKFVDFEGRSETVFRHVDHVVQDCFGLTHVEYSGTRTFGELWVNDGFVSHVATDIPLQNAIMLLGPSLRERRSG